MYADQSLVSQVIQHDASFTRPDIAFCADQSFPHPDLVDRFLAQASSGESLSLDDIAYFSGLRRAECKRTNGQYSLTWSFLHEFFGRFPCNLSFALLFLTDAYFSLGSGNGALMYSIFGGNVKDLRIWLAEGRFPDGWEPKNREALGHSIAVSSLLFPERSGRALILSAHSKRKSPHSLSSSTSMRSRSSGLGTRLTPGSMKRKLYALRRSSIVARLSQLCL